MILKKLGIALFFVLLFVSPARADSATVSDISKQLVCQCGCNMVLGNCSHAECASREAMTALLRQEIAQDKSAAEIIQSFVARYGEKVLSAPPKQGFNLTAWILPFAAILVGGGVIYLALKKWVKQGKNRQINTITEAQEGGEEYWERLEKELKEFKETGFR